MENADKPINPIHNSDGFPSYETVINQDGVLTGLTKREYFAGLAMQTFDLEFYKKRFGRETRDHLIELVKDSISIADELLKQLEATEL